MYPKGELSVLSRQTQPIHPAMASENSRSRNVSSVNKGMETVHTNTHQSLPFILAINAGERRRGGHVWAGPASLQSWVPFSPLQSQGSAAFQSPILKAAVDLKGGSDVICSLAPAAQ